MQLNLAIVSPFPPPFGGMSVLAQTLKRCLEAQSVEIIPINTHAASKLNYNYKKTYEAIAYLLSLRKIVHADIILVISSSGAFFYAKALPALIAGKILGKPVILDFVGGAFIDKLNASNSFLVKCLKKYDCILVPTPTFEKVFSAAQIPSALFPHIVDIERFSAKNKKAANPVLLAAKNLEDHSGIKSLIRAFAEIQKKFPEARFNIAGDGPNKASLQQLVQDLNLTGVEFLGNVDYDHMPALFDKATIFIHGTKYESFGIVLVEALASSTPVVSTNVGGIPDIIKDGVNGFLVAYNDHNSMAERVIRLIEDKNVYRRFVENGLLTASLYSGQNLAPKLVDILKSIASKT